MNYKIKINREIIIFLFKYKNLYLIIIVYIEFILFYKK